MWDRWRFIRYSLGWKNKKIIWNGIATGKIKVVIGARSSMFLPFNSQLSLYIVAVFFGLSQGGIVPIYTVIISKFLPTNEVAERVGLLIFATIIGMSLGGWLSGEIFDYTNSYKLAFLNGIFWNIINVSIMVYLYLVYINSKRIND